MHQELIVLPIQQQEIFMCFVIAINSEFKIVNLLLICINVSLDQNIDIFCFGVLDVEILSILIASYEINAWLRFERLTILNGTAFDEI